MHIPGKAMIYVPDGIEPGAALARTTHMAIVAHQDDAEIIAYDIIEKCHGNPSEWFTAVIVADGSGSPRHGKYIGIEAEELVGIRNLEQEEAARIGGYGAAVMLGHASAKVKQSRGGIIDEELASILKQSKPRVVYTHNPYDSHDTHVAVFMRTIAALRSLLPNYRPDMILGCEVWRGLDWMLPEDRKILDVSARPGLSESLLGAFKSQLGTGKRYDLAVKARWRANATFDNARAQDASSAIAYAVDLGPLLDNPGLDVIAFAENHVKRFSDDVIGRISRLGGA